MSILDKFVGGAARAPNDNDSAEVCANARQLAGGEGDWVGFVLDRYGHIERAFAEVKAAGSPAASRAAQEHLGALLTAHSMADEDAMANSASGDANTPVIGLADLDPTSEDYLDKLEHLRAALSHHVHPQDGSCRNISSGSSPSFRRCRNPIPSNSPQAAP